MNEKNELQLIEFYLEQENEQEIALSVKVSDFFKEVLNEEGYTELLKEIERFGLMLNEKIRPGVYK